MPQAVMLSFREEVKVLFCLFVWSVVFCLLTSALPVQTGRGRKQRKLSSHKSTYVIYGFSRPSSSSTGRSDKQYTLSSRDEDESDSRLEERMTAQEGMLGPVVS